MRIRSIQRREWFAIGVLALVVLAGIAVGERVDRYIDSVQNDPALEQSAVPLPDSPRLRLIRKNATKLAPLHSRLEPPQPGDWLSEHSEPGQTFDQFLMDHREPRPSSHRALYFVALGELTETQRRLLADTLEFVELFYGLPVEMLDPIALNDLPESTVRIRPRWGDEQTLTTHLLFRVLRPLRPADAVALVGFTARDLWPGTDLSFVFGEASTADRVAVCSIARFGDTDAGEVAYSKCLRRTLGTVVHETGHCLGFRHCIAWKCKMNGSNHLAESDSRPLEFCPECLAKVWWMCEADAIVRAERLAEFAARERLVSEARHWRQAVAKLKAGD